MIMGNLIITEEEKKHIHNLYVEKNIVNPDLQNEGLKNKLLGGLAALSMMVSSCQSITPEEKSRLQKEIQILNKEQEQGEEKSKYYVSHLDSLRDEKKRLEETINDEKKKLGIYKSGRAPKYILTLEFQETRMADIDDIGNLDNLIDVMQFSFDIPVDEQYYNENKIGKLLVEGSRPFKFGNFGEITVVGKKIE